MDKRLIDKVLNYSNDRLLKLEAFTYSQKSTPSKREIGLISQEVNAVEPLLVKATGQGLISVDYERFGVALFSIVKAQQNQIDELRREITSLKNKKK